MLCKLCWFLGERSEIFLHGVTFLQDRRYKTQNNRKTPGDNTKEQMMKWNQIRIYFCTILITGLVCVSAQAADVTHSDIPTGSNWYVHINLELIQNSEVGRRLMLETVDEALEDIQEELNVDIRGEIQGITVFGGSLPRSGGLENDGAVILHGALDVDTQDGLLLALERKGAEVSVLEDAGLTYYRVQKDEGTMTYTDENGHVEDVDWGHHEELYFSFGATQTLVTQNLEMMQTFLDAGAYLGGFEVVDPEALLVLQADRALMQGGANTSVDIGGDWDSSVLRNVDAVALVIAEEQDGVQISARLKAVSAEAAMSVRNIVEGLVALKALDQSEGTLGEILRQVRFENDGSVLNVNVPIAADQVEALRDNM